MSTWIERTIFFVFTALLIWVACLMYKRKWEKPFSVALILAFVTAFLATGWFQGFFKTGVASILVTRITTLNTALDSYIQTTRDIQSELTNLTSRIRNEQDQLSMRQSNVFDSVAAIAIRERNAQDTAHALSALSQQLDAGRKAIEASQVQISNHQKRMEDISSLVKTIHEQVTTEIVNPATTNVMLIGRKADGSFGMLFRLSHYPIGPTINARYQSGNMLPTSMMIIENTLFWKTTGSPESIRSEKFFVSYVPDPTRKQDTLADIQVDHEGKLKAGGFILSDYTWIDYHTNTPNKASEAIGAAP